MTTRNPFRKIEHFFELLGMILAVIIGFGFLLGLFVAAPIWGIVAGDPWSGFFVYFILILVGSIYALGYGVEALWKKIITPWWESKRNAWDEKHD